ncbi:MAG: ribonuclease P protein component [Proteobacteria bacterium]|nr:ribonuclease P protein component [Pseudomonadota bacterium]
MKHRWGKERRILKSLDIKYVQSKGKSWRCKYFLVKRVKSISSRVAFTVSKKVGCAPVRNKIKRLLREILRKRELPKMDLVFIVYKGAIFAEFKDFERSVDLFLAEIEAQKNGNR